MDSAPALLLVARQTLQFNRATAYQRDAVTFTTLLQRCATHAHDILVALQDSRTDAILSIGHDRLQRDACHIHDKTLRCSFLGNVTVYRDLKVHYATCATSPALPANPL